MAIIEMLQDPAIAIEDNLMWTANTGPPFGELNTGKRWEDAETKSKVSASGFNVCPIILYTDGASPDFRRNLSLKPIVVSCGNYVGSVCRRDVGKRCVGFWPKLPVSTGVLYACITP